MRKFNEIFRAQVLFMKHLHQKIYVNIFMCARFRRVLRRWNGDEGMPRRFRNKARYVFMFYHNCFEYIMGSLTERARVHQVYGISKLFIQTGKI